VHRITGRFIPPSPLGSTAIAAFVLAAAGCAGVAAAACRIESPTHRVTVLELYTSEGCNSCPPADRWLSRLRDRNLEAQMVPLAFHVDYWNSLGWVDPFSQPTFSARQHSVAERNRSRVVYTPQLVLDGRDWRSWREADELSARLTTLNAETPGASIRASARLAVDHIEVKGTVTFGEAAHARAALTWLAVYEDGLTSAVAAGENGGRTLDHDYVVRALIGPLHAAVDSVVALDKSIPLGARWKPQRLGIAVFSEVGPTGRILQAASASGCF
jgi:hypothetical protein